jgi:hypothetical protein
LHFPFHFYDRIVAVSIPVTTIRTFVEHGGL